MVNKLFCDRCDKQIPENIDNEIHFTGKRNTRFGYDKRINLCNMCLEKFETFLKGDEE